MASKGCMTPNWPPSSSTTRTSRARMRSFTRVRSVARKLRSAINPPPERHPGATPAHPGPDGRRRGTQGDDYSMRCARGETGTRRLRLTFSHCAVLRGWSGSIVGKLVVYPQAFVYVSKHTACENRRL